MTNPPDFISQEINPDNVPMKMGLGEIGKAAETEEKIESEDTLIQIIPGLLSIRVCGQNGKDGMGACNGLCSSKIINCVGNHCYCSIIGNSGSRRRTIYKSEVLRKNERRKNERRKLEEEREDKGSFSRVVLNPVTNQSQAQFLPASQPTTTEQCDEWRRERCPASR